jgi:uncharacterized repeat protein (TIGR01451 family)
MTRSKRPKRRKSARDIKRELRSIYANTDGSVPDLTKLKQRNKSTLTSILIKAIGILAVISALAWAGFFFFTGGIFQSSETLNLTIEGPEEIKSGEETSYTFRYENNGDVPVASLSMKLNLPDTFHIYSTVPEATQTGEWTIGSLSAGSDGAITITGVFLAPAPSSQRLQALFTYKPANFSSEFQDIVTHQIDIEDSVVALSFTGPEKALAGDTSEYVINIQNTGRDPVYNVRVTPNLTDNFTISDTQPEREEGQTYWVIDALEPGDLKAITINGSFTSTASGEQNLSTTVGFVQNNIVHPQAQQTLITDVLGGSITFSVILNGSTQDQSAELSETMRLSLDYANNSSESIEDISFDLTITTPDGTEPIHWSQANLGGGTRTGNEINWSNLDDLEPDDSGVIDLSLPIFPQIDEGEADQFTINVTLTLNKVGDISSTRTLESTPITVSLNSDTDISALARYYSQSGSAIGTGPLPPEVGETTSYRIYWNVSNSLHTIKDVRLSTTLPSDVAWLDNTDTDIGNITYNSTTRQISWDTSKLLDQLGNAGAWFEVAINPDSSDVGRFIKLINTTSLEATDSVTGNKLNTSANEVTTELPEDETAKGQGAVNE